MSYNFNSFNLKPQVASIGNIGTSTYPFQAGYFDNLYVNGSSVAPQEVTGSITVTGNITVLTPGNDKTVMGEVHLTGKDSVTGDVAAGTINFLLTTDGSGAVTVEDSVVITLKGDAYTPAWTFDVAAVTTTLVVNINNSSNLVNWKIKITTCEL